MMGRSRDELFELGSRLDLSMIDQFRLVEVSNGGTRCGCILVPECFIYDKRSKPFDRGVYMQCCATDGRVSFRAFYRGYQVVKFVESMMRLEESGYINTSLIGDVLHVYLVDVEAYRPEDLHRVRRQEELSTKPRNIQSFQGTTFSPFDCVPDNCSPEVWKEWIRVRKENRWSVRKAHCKRMKQDVESFGEDGEQAVKNSIRNNWQGLFPPNKKKTSSQSTQILGEVCRQDYEDEF